ncbi:hypothetical protein LJR027_004110 [Terrabacter sp. LjRoot27]|uniref:hypothetical protein n=1 Tax=Terrabacter sp. LjRoot27 TaxID=3342306 RepID=UPI003ED11628
MTEWLWSALGGLVVGFLTGVVASFFEPVRHVAERLGRRTFERSPLDVNVETDLGIIWAGSPDWNAACFWVPDTGPLGAPPGTLAEWQKWVAGHGGYDSGTSTVLLTVVARSKVTVVISPPLVTATSHPLPAGRYLARPTAGAEVHPLGFDISLMDAGQSWVTLSDIDGPRFAPLSWSLSEGQVERFFLKVTPENGRLWRWRLQLPLIVDGRRILHDVDNDGEDFVVVGHPPDIDDQLYVETEWKARSEL